MDLNLILEKILLRLTGVRPSAHTKRTAYSLFQNLIGNAIKYRKFREPASVLLSAQRVVERYGGKIAVESRRGQGSAFMFTLPNAITDREEGE